MIKCVHFISILTEIYRDMACIHVAYLYGFDMLVSNKKLQKQYFREERSTR